MAKINRPPRLAEWLLFICLHQDNAFHRIGDFEEVFHSIQENSGRIKASLWYWIQVLRSVPNFIYNSIYWSMAMLKNYLKTSLRNIKKHRAFTVINISGLAIGLACCMLLGLYINSELSFDAYHLKKNRIFRVGEEMSFNNFSSKQSSTNGVIAAALQAYPEVEKTARFRYLFTSAKYKDKQFSDRFYYSDAAVFDIFSWPFIEGDPKTALDAPYTVVLTRESADKYFGDEDPIGKIITLNEDENFKVTGILADIPRYSTIRFTGLCSFKTLYASKKQAPRILTDWTSHNFRTFVLLKKDVDAYDFENKIKDIYYDYAADELKANGSAYSVFLQPLKDIYLRPLQRDFGPITYVYIFSVVAVFILLIACVNFMNLSTARSMTRATEVGVRKVFGANRSRLVRQFLTEALLLSILSMIIALGITLCILPEISNFAQRDLVSDFFQISWLIPGILLITLLVGLIAGSYPAFMLSKFDPVQVIKNRLDAPKNNLNLRRILVVGQFIISVTLIIGTALVIQQLDYLKNKEVGFDKEHTVCIPVRNQLVRQMLPVLQDNISRIPEVINTGCTSRLPGWGAPMNSKIPEGYTKENTQLMQEINIDENFLPTIGIEIVEGRNFSREFVNDARGSVIINETAAIRYGWDNPIGKTIRTLNTDQPETNEYVARTVIGVVKDFHLSGVTREIEPAFIANQLDYPFAYGKIQALAINIKSGDTGAVLSELEVAWKELFPQKPFAYFFLDEDFNEQFISVERSRNILSYFTFLAIFIACLGLFGMVAYSAEKRTKEIGIRKTLGSSVSQIVILLSKELILLVLAGNIIAYPIAYFALSQWLQDFPYRIEIGASTFLFSTLLALVISFFTIAWQSLKAALANPIDSLKYE